MSSRQYDEMILREPAGRGVRLVALSLIDVAEKGGEKLASVSNELADGGAGGDEALHDFRVSVRRLRSWVRAFKPLLFDDVSRKWRRRLAKVADATNATRDATVHLEWLGKERAALTEKQRIGHEWLSERLAEERSRGTQRALAAAADFTELIPKLARKLTFYRAQVTEPERTARFGYVMAEAVRSHSERLRRQLSGVHDFTDVKEAHRARISAKNLRYIVERVANLVADGDAIVETLKTLQDSLGDLNDVHVFAKEMVTATEKSEDDRAVRGRARDPRPGIRGLTRRLHERGMQSFAELERNWLNDAGAQFFERVREFADAIEHRASLGAEVEHKYLLTRLPAATVGAPSVEAPATRILGEAARSL